MKRTLRESLVDYDIALLRALAEVRGAVLTSNHRLRAADELASQLSAPASLAIALGDLSPAETESLTTLQAAGGWMEAPRFARRFGALRTMGPGRLERERPWLSPANPAEGLWYRALTFKGFRQTETGVVEVVYIPDDLLALLPDLSQGQLPSTARETGFAVEPAAPPSDPRPANTDVVEDVFGVLVTARNHGLRLRADGSLHSKDLHAINALCVTPLPAASVANDDHLPFIVHLCRAAELITISQGRLTLNPDPARAWLQAPLANRLLVLQTAWRDDPNWNDLWRVPSLKPQPTGWKNDPVLARRKVLGFLAHCHPGDWYGLDELAKAIKSSDPDFQRPDGDFTSWYIHDLHGQPLMGFEHWDEVEGDLLRYLVSSPLHWLGVADLGFEEEFGQPTTFRLTETGLPLLPIAPPTADVPSPSNQAAHPALVVRDDFTVRVPLDAGLYTRFQLARFADFSGREADHIDYRLSPLSLARARRQGITAGQVSAFLDRVSRDPVPVKVSVGLRGWYELGGRVRLEQETVLRVDRPETLEALRRNPTIAPLLGQVLGPKAVLVPRANVRKIRQWLTEQSYLEVTAEE